MALKNTNIANANPSAIVNKAFVDALYKEQFGRVATNAEYDRFKNVTVKDASNIVLAKNSPFISTQPTQVNPYTQANPLTTNPYQTISTKATNPQMSTVATPTKSAAQMLEEWKAAQRAQAIANQGQSTRTNVTPSATVNQPESYYNKPTTPQQASGQLTNTTQNPTKERSDAEKARLKTLHDSIDGMNYSAEQKAILHQLVEDDSLKGQTIQDTATINKIVQDAATKAEANIAPYYEKLTAREINDLKTNMEKIRSDANRYAESEAIDYNQKLQNTKQSLRARGLTFSGIGRQTLGSEGIIDSSGVKGTVQKAREMLWDQKTADIQNEASRLQTNAERKLGTSATPTSGSFTTPYGEKALTVKQTNPTDIGIGDIQAQRLKDLATTQADIIKGYKSYI